MAGFAGHPFGRQVGGFIEERRVALQAGRGLLHGPGDSGRLGVGLGFVSFKLVKARA